MTIYFCLGAFFVINLLGFAFIWSSLILAKEHDAKRGLD
jgi:hypothetical protein